jgi:hypothetical protein
MATNTETLNQTVNAESFVLQTWAALGEVTSGKFTAKQIDFAESWLAQVGQRLSAGQTSVLEHATLLTLAQLDSTHAFVLEKSGSHINLYLWPYLWQSWHILAGSTTPAVSREDWQSLPRLPRKVLSQTNRDIAVVYDTAFFSPKRTELLFEPLNSKSSIVTRITSASFWNARTALFVAFSMLLLCFPITREILLGMIFGMMGASMNEYIVHLGVGHSSSSFARGFRRLGYIGLFAEEINLAHRVHHSKMLTDFRTAFSSEKDRQRVDAYVSRESEKLVFERIKAGLVPESKAASEIERIIRELKSGGYGVDGTLAGCIAMNVLAFPFFLSNFLLSLLFAGGTVFLVTSCIFLSGFIMQSLFSHRYLHLTNDDLEKSKADGSTTAFMRWFMTTPVAELQTRRHFRHHHEKYDYQGTANGVIMSFSFADFPLRKGVREAEVSHLVQMRKQGFLDDARSKKS